MDLVAYLRILRRHWRLIVVATVIGAVVGAASTLLESETEPQARSYYKATHTLFLDTSGQGDFRPVFNNLDQMAVFVLTGDVPRRVAATLGGQPAELTTHIFTTTNGTLQTLDITAADRNPRQAEDLANTFAEELRETIEEKERLRFEQDRDSTLKRLDNLQAQITQLDAVIATRPPDVEIRTAERNSLINAYRTVYERFQSIASRGDAFTSLSTIQTGEAQEISKGEYDVRITRGQLGENQVRADTFTTNSEVTTSGSSGSARLDSPTARGVLGAVLGLLVGIGLSLVADRVDRRLRTREDFETAFAMPVLAEMPSLKTNEQRAFELSVHTAPFSRSTEAYRAIRSSLLFQRPINAGQADSLALTVMVASANPKEGKSTTAANLAATFAESGLQVLAVNCDFRRPTLHRYFDTDNEPRRVLDSGIEGLMIVSDVAGPENPSPAYIVDQQRRLVQTSRGRFDVVILDTAPLLSTNDATELIDLADLVLLVGRVGLTTSDAAHRTRELLSRLDAPAAGVVVVGSEAATNDYYYYYSRSRAKQLDGQGGATPSDNDRDDANNGSDPRRSKAKRRSGKSS